MPLFIKFQLRRLLSASPRRRAGESYKTGHIERNYKTDIIEGRATGARPGPANRVVRKDRWTMGRVPAIRSAVYEYQKLTAGGKLQSTWEYNMPLCWLISNV